MFLEERILRHIEKMETQMSALSDAIATLTADVADVQAKVAAIVTAIGGGVVTQADLDALTAADQALKKASADLAAATPSP
jgi:predicted  nucleic acid-binding Zn-ribbon protein